MTHSTSTSPRLDTTVSDRASAYRRSFLAHLPDRVYLGLAGFAAFIAFALVVYLLYVTWENTSLVWETFGVWGFITGTEWIPYPAEGDPILGALPFIYGTVITSAIALVVAVPLAVGIALATTVVLPSRLQAPVANVINLLAAVPSVVFGFWGLVVLVPASRPVLEWIAAHNLRTLGGVAVILIALGFACARVLRVVLLATGVFFASLVTLTLIEVPGLPHPEAPFTLLSGPVLSGSYVMASMVLAAMVLPVITAIVREVFSTVPIDQREAAYALGATRWEMIRHSMIPWARSGIVGASALGLGRALGETIALAMVAGNVQNIGGSLLGPTYTAAGVIALQMGESDGIQLAALTALGLVLFAITFVINLAARGLVRRGAGGVGPLSRIRARIFPVRANGEAQEECPPPSAAPLSTKSIPKVSLARRLRSYGAETSILLAVLIGATPLGVLLYEVIREGVAILSWDFFTQAQPVNPNEVLGYGIKDAMVGTLVLSGIATSLAAPLGILTALFMSELYGRGGGPRRIADTLGMFVDVLLGMPSIMAGVTVYLAIVVAMGRFSAMAGGIALAIVMFPIVVRSADEVLRLVPIAQKEAAQALGASRWRTTWSVVLPTAAPGILTGLILAIARASGETAPLLFTSLGSQQGFDGIWEPIASMAQLIYGFTIQVRTDDSVTFSWGATLVLVGYILLLTMIARGVTRLGNLKGRR